MTDDAKKWEEFIPDVPVEQALLSGGLEMILDQGIIHAYQKWCGKSEVTETARTESIMVSCPFPSHPDKIPSAWLNSEKNVWYCGACDVGGDIMDLGAIHFDLSIPGYKEGKSFPRLIEMMLVSMGVDIDAMRTEMGKQRLLAIERVDGSVDHPKGPVVTVADPDKGAVFPTTPLDWESMLVDKTFLKSWMDAARGVSVPNEYLFFLGLQMVSLGVGRRVHLTTTSPVYSNVMIALMGGTAIGKSRAIRIAEKVVREALPHDDTDVSSLGVKHVGRPASGESLVDAFSWLPLSAPKELSVNGWIQIDEMAELMKAAGRRGSTIREFLLQMYDGKPEIESSPRSTGRVVARDPHLNMVLGAQPEAMQHILSDNDTVSGFANRFMYVHGTRKPRQPWTEVVQPDLTGLDVQLNTLKNWSVTKSLKPEGGDMMLDPMAEVLMDETLVWIDKTVREAGEVFSRLELHLYKFIILLCANEQTDIVGVDHIKKARLLVEFLLPTTTKVADAVSEQGDVDRHMDRIEEILKWYKPDKDKDPSGADMRAQFSKRMKGQRSTFEKALKIMISAGEVEEAPITPENLAKGNRTIRYRLVQDPASYR